VYEVGVAPRGELFANSAEPCGLLLDGTAEVRLADQVHPPEAGDI
jgi:hypothetical protein